ncbi:MAG: hypothetical protein QM781_17880 [Chitinophagaceae bacterium]
MNKLFFSFLLLLCSLASPGQKGNFGILTYTVPAGYQLVKADNLLTYFRQDTKTGAYCKFVIYQTLPDQGSPQQNFDFFWDNMLKKAFNVTGAANMQPAGILKGWQLLMGTTIYADNGVNTMAILTSFSGKNIMQNVCILSNADIYKADIESFIASVDVSEEIAAAPVQNTNTNQGATQPASSVVGLWTVRDDQTLGIFTGNTKDNTIGYFRHGYSFNADRTYSYYNKIFLTRSKTISFAYETGTWSVNGNQLTVTPTKGQNEEWSKSASGEKDEWGHRLKTTTRKLESVTYTFSKKTSPVDHLTRLVLQYDKETDRDGKYYDKSLHQWMYSPLDNDAGDLPPGVKLTAAATATTTPALPATTTTSANVKYEVWMCHCYTTGSLSSMAFKSVVLSPDGKCLYYLPEKGLNGITPANSNESGSWGSVTDKGKMLQLRNERYGNMELYKISATAMSRYSDLKSSIYKKVKPVDGLRFEGAYSPELSYYNGKTDVISRQIDPNKRPIIFFKKDGTYINEGIEFSNLTLNDPYALGKGTYEVVNYSLILTTQSGRKLQVAFTPVLDANPAATNNSGLIINNNLFYRLGKDFVPHN